jgi:hypothetical protein
VVALESADRKFTVLGATGNQTLRFDEQDVTLAEALSQSGGLQSPRADRTGVFLYRRVPRDVLISLGADVAHIPGYDVTTIFRFDFTDPNVLFTADEFHVADGDILYVADSVNANISERAVGPHEFRAGPGRVHTAGNLRRLSDGSARRFAFDAALFFCPIA